MNRASVLAMIASLITLVVSIGVYLKLHRLEIEVMKVRDAAEEASQEAEEAKNAADEAKNAAEEAR